MASSQGSAGELNEGPCEGRSGPLGEFPPHPPAGEDSDARGNHLPVARVKKIMKEGEHPGMISSDAPVVLARACEMLIRDLTLQSWDYTQMTKRCTLQRQDITCAIFKSNVYNFLYDVLTLEDLKPVMEAPHPTVRTMNLGDSLLSPHGVLNKLSHGPVHPKGSPGRRVQPHPYRDMRGAPGASLEDGDSGGSESFPVPEALRPAGGDVIATADDL